MASFDDWLKTLGKTTKGSERTGWDILFLAFVIHACDAFIRLPGGRVDFYIWSIFFVAYAILAIMAARRLGTWRDPLIVSALAAFVIPFFYSYVARSSLVIGMLVLLMPTWIIYLLVIRGERYPIPIIGQLFESIGIEWFDLSFLYIIFWVIFLTMSYMPQVQTYASNQGYDLPTVSPGIVWRYTVTTFTRAAVSAYQAVFITAPAIVTKEVARTIAIASGDYYTGTVDKNADKKVGVYVLPLKPTQPEFNEGDTIDVYTTVAAETILQPILIHLTCTAEPGKIKATEIRPEPDFTVTTSATKQVDCFFKGLSAKQYAAKLTADFNFATRAYQKVYFMDEERLNEYRRRGVDPLENFPDKKPSTVNTPGPLIIGMTESFEKQPVGITQGKWGPTIGVTLDNVWAGQMKQLTNIIFYTPKGMEVTDINGIATSPTSCSALLEEERTACDDKIENIYIMPETELQRFVNRTVNTFRAHTKIMDSAVLLGGEQISLKNVKVTAYYDYSYSVQSSSFTVKGVTT